MTAFSKEDAQKRERTLLSAALLSAPGPLVTGLAAISSNSSTQLADFIRRSAELVALIVSWWVFRYVQHHREISTARQNQLERMANLSVAGAMICSGIVMLLIAVSRLSNYEPAGSVIGGLVIAVMGLIVNAWFWRRYTALTREQYNPVTEAQQKLYRAKASVDFVVVLALSAVMIAPEHPITRYIDVFGSMAVAVYLLYTGIGLINPSWAKSVFSQSARKSSPPQADQPPT